MTKVKTTISYVILVLASFLSAFPLYYMISGATNASIDIVRGKLIPGTHLLENYKTFIEAARLEGLSEIKIFFTMFIPVMKSTYGAAMTVTFMNAWNNYLWPTIILQDKNEVTMPMLVANLKSGYSVDYGMLMLGVLICTLPTAIIFLCLQKSFANGIAGAVK